MAAAGNSKQNRIVMLCMAAVLIFGVITAWVVPAGEFPTTGYAIFSMCLDGAMTLLLAGLIYGERQAAPSALRTAAVLAGGAGVLAGVAQVLIRFTSDHAWWTGNYLPPVFN